MADTYCWTMVGSIPVPLVGPLQTTAYLPVWLILGAHLQWLAERLFQPAGKRQLAGPAPAEAPLIVARLQELLMPQLPEQVPRPLHGPATA